ncbi:MAG: linear amide C-N hydrolase [Smithellaceae bacterium]|nr:linear amide C-N hydrolase [Syntrophaceae bacterium]MDD4240619.1 linear amide C-N hydrolase [Smithellaceae bacterium]NLX52047.1 linear amide C-N hydrolase [Deltaproteobacteria bacterium]
MNLRRKNMLAAGIIAGMLLLAAVSAEACSRIVYLGPQDTVLTARSMDWIEDMKTHLWAFPRGMARDGRVGARSLRWTSLYGSVIASAYDNSTTDGLNEKGLAANLLWLAESRYPAWDGKKTGLALSVWTQYALDNFATVAEAVEAMRREPFALVTAKAPGVAGLATVHLSVSDATGDSAIFECLGGKLVISHSRDYQVMTNSPSYDGQLALNEYWKQIGGTVMLPGTNRSADRFARAWFYINAIPKTADLRIALAGVFSVIRNVSVPYGISTPGQPNISSTRWRTVSDHKNKVYYFESTLTPNLFWVTLDRLDFSASAPVRKLELRDDRFLAGDTAKLFAPARPFDFLGL